MTKQVSAIEDLVRRLAAATESSRPLDTAIEAVIDGGPIPVLKVEVMPGVWEEKLNAIVSYTAPNYTASIDAALTLVPEGWEAIIYTETRVAELYPTVGVKRPAGIRARSNGATPAIALCIAALKARETLSPREGCDNAN